MITSRTYKVKERKLLWDEENRLTAIDDNGFISSYWYDYGGERVIKEAGGNEGVYVNSLFSGGRTDNSTFTLYVNPYMVVNQGGHYTKHIYIGSQRVVSKLGDMDSYGADPRRIEYAGTNVDNVVIDYVNKYKNAQEQVKDNYKYFEVKYLGKDNDDYVNGQGFCCTDNAVKMQTMDANIGGGNDNPEKLQFYYHSDHLGSTSLITNLDGDVVQHVEYIPFGEVFLEERNNKWNTPFLFNGKELDEETGLYYYGARYYNPRESVFLSVDPKMMKYPAMSPYAYCANNPVKLVDPDGKDFRLRVYEKDGQKHIEISTTVYITGEGAADKVKAYNDFVVANANKLEGTYKTDDGIEYKVALNIVYEVGTEGKNKELRSKRKYENQLWETSGDNILELSGKDIISNVLPVGSYHGELGSSELSSSPATAFHEVLHFLGLDDWYDVIFINGVRRTTPYKDFENDIMAANSKDWIISKIHWDNLGKKSLEIWSKWEKYWEKSKKRQEIIGTMPGKIENAQKWREQNNKKTEE